MRLTSKGQVTIPLALRRGYGLDPLAMTASGHKNWRSRNDYRNKA